MKEIAVYNTIGNSQISIRVAIRNNYKPCKKDSRFKNFGAITVESVYNTNKEECYWDNLIFFYNNSNKQIKKQCMQELIDKNLYEEEIFKTIKKMIKHLIKYKYLHKNEIR